MAFGARMENIGKGELLLSVTGICIFEIAARFIVVPFIEKGLG
jgi:hypothetical protein